MAMGLREKGQHLVAVRLNEKKVGPKRKYKFLKREWLNAIFVIWLWFMVIVALIIYKSMDDENRKKREEVLVSMCDQRARMLQDQFSVSVNHVHALAILVSTFHFYKDPSAIDQETFAEYTARTAFERPLLNGVAYAQRVVHSEREGFEKQHGWTIRTMGTEPSLIRDEYAPVIFAQETVSYLQSIDMMSGEEDRENILRARFTGKAVLTSPFRLLGSHHLGVVLTFPVYKSKLSASPSVEERIKATAGYIGGAFDVESLVEKLLGQLAGNQAIVVNVYDVTNSSDPLVMYGQQTQDGDMSLEHTSTLDFGDPFRKHLMVCRYHQKATILWTAVTNACLCFVIGFLGGYLIYSAAVHIVKVEEDFHEMQELKSRAEAADVAKSQFLATVSHEIRTPMNGILGMLALLLHTELSSTQKDYAKTAQDCGKALITLMNEVLDRAKIEAGKLELEAVPFDLRSILDDVLSLFSEKSRHKGIELAVLVSDKVPDIVLGDPGRFRQVITNLVGNSVKFTERGHILVGVHLAENMKPIADAEVESCMNGVGPNVFLSNSYQSTSLSGCEAADDRNSWDNFKYLTADEENRMTMEEPSQNITLLVCVEDTGIGIPLHAQGSVFTPFMQADSSTSRNYGGTGIGLSISKCLVELMGGQINFISRPHVGSTFSFTAVFRRCSEISDSRNSLQKDLLSGFNGLTTIIVDGNPVRAAVTKYHLKRLGIVAEVINSIKSTISMLGQNGSQNSIKERQPDMILIEKDLWISSEDSPIPLPKQSGQMYKSPKLFLLATSITNSEFDKAKQAGLADNFIMKPLRASMVAACLQQVLGTGKKTQPGKDSSPISLKGLLCGKRILVVDDNRVNRRVAAGALKKFGADVECAESGKAAIGLLGLPHTFDACFMDIQMPEMDGFEVTRRIRMMESEVNKQQHVNGGSASSDERRHAMWHLPILAMTADVIHATYDECLKCGMDGYVSKPFEEENLYQAVAKFFERKSIPQS